MGVLQDDERSLRIAQLRTYREKVLEFTLVLPVRSDDGNRADEAGADPERTVRPDEEVLRCLG